jgi:hypothetical protein
LAIVVFLDLGLPEVLVAVVGVLYTLGLPDSPVAMAVRDLMAVLDQQGHLHLLCASLLPEA